MLSPWMPLPLEATQWMLCATWMPTTRDVECGIDSCIHATLYMWKTSIWQSIWKDRTQQKTETSTIGSKFMANKRIESLNFIICMNWIPLPWWANVVCNTYKHLRNRISSNLGWRRNSSLLLIAIRAKPKRHVRGAQHRDKKASK